MPNKIDLKPGLKKLGSYDKIAMYAVAHGDFIDSPEELSKAWGRALILIMDICADGERTYDLENFTNEDWLYSEYKKEYSRRFSDRG